MVLGFAAAPSMFNTLAGYLLILYFPTAFTLTALQLFKKTTTWSWLVFVLAVIGAHYFIWGYVNLTADSVGQPTTVNTIPTAVPAVR
jgi:hypothetical protein